MRRPPLKQMLPSVKVIPATVIPALRKGEASQEITNNKTSSHLYSME